MKKSIIIEESAEQQMIRALQEGYDEFREGDSLYAAKKFNEAIIISTIIMGTEGSFIGSICILCSRLLL